MPPPADRQRLGPYQLLGELGRGSAGVVYHGRHETSRAEHALKWLDLGRASVELLLRFQREVELLAALPEHPHLVAFRGCGAEGDGWWFAMDLQPGGTLEQQRRAGPAPPRQAAAWVRDVARGLAELHGRGLVHRDVKPGNVLLDADGRARLGDLGLVRSLEEQQRLTRTGALLGTPMYMPPEVVGGAPWSPAGDVYALGLLLFALLSGRRPFEGRSNMEVLPAVREGRLPALREVAPEAPPALERLYERARQRDPQARPTADELAAALDAWLTPAHDAPARREPRRLLLGLAAALALVAVALAALLLRSSGEAPAQPPPPAQAPGPGAEEAERALAAAQALLATDPGLAARRFAELEVRLRSDPGQVAALRAEALRGARWALVRVQRGFLRRVEPVPGLEDMALGPHPRTLWVCGEQGLAGRSVSTGAPTETGIPAGTEALACAVSPGGEWLLLARGDAAELWSLTPREEAPRLRLELGQAASACAVSAAGVLAAASDERLVVRWPEGRELRLDLIRDDDDDEVNQVAFSPHGQLVAVAADAGLFVVDLRQESPLARRVTDTSANGVAFTPDGRHLLALEHALDTWRVPRDPDGPWTRHDPLQLPRSHEANCGAIGAAGALLVTGHEEHPVLRRWTLGDDGTPRPDLEVPVRHGAEVIECALSPDGALLASGDDDGVVCLWWLLEGPPPEELLPALPGWDQDPPAAVLRALEAR